MAGESASMKIDIPGVDFGALARQAIAEKMTEALVGADDSVRKIVAVALTTKVSSDTGRRSDYSHQNDVPYVEWLAHDLVRAATRAALASKLEALRPTVEREIEAALKASIKPAARALAQTFIENAKSHYSVTVNVAFTEQRRS